MRLTGFAVSLGINIGISGGVVAGLLGGFLGGLVTGSLDALRDFSLGSFWLVMIFLPFFFWFFVSFNPNYDEMRPMLRQNIRQIALVAYVPAVVASVVAFMMPVTMAPIVLGKGVGFDTVSQWYNSVFTVLLGAPFIALAVVSAAGFALVAWLIGKAPAE